MFNEAPVAQCLRLAFIGGIASIALGSLPTFAQEVQTGEKVQITGSNIRRAQTETASPVQTLTREDIDRSGKQSVAELLQTLALDNNGSVPTTFGNGFSRSGSGISLRGLGVGATLVLVNGRRVAPFALADDGTKSYVDLNIIPLEAVERVEILKDGGSAIYGSDAIAGVVNIILKKEINGTTLSGVVGQSLQYGDGRDTRAAITTGFGNLDVDKYNVLFDLEYHKKEPIALSNRTDRGRVGYTDLRGEGFNATDTTGGGTAAGGTGAIVAGGLTGGSSINGNVRNPTSLIYYSRDNTSAATGFTRTFPGANCSSLTSHPQGDPGGGCLTDVTQEFRQVQPKQENWNFYGRGNLQINDNLLAYVEGNYFNNRESGILTPSTVNGTTVSPTIINPSAVGTLAANHPDNPYFGTAARLRYTAYDLGPRRFITNNEFTRGLAGLKGSFFGWDFDTAIEYSRDHLTGIDTGFFQVNVLNALLNPSAANVALARSTSPAYAALPAGTFYRIAENAGLNSAAVYNALSPNVYSYGKSEEALADFKASRELFNLPGGAFGVAVGAEVRHEQNSLTPTTGTDIGQTLGLGYSAYTLNRNIEAAYAEIVAPVIKQVELSAAARYDHYQVVGNAFNPKGGIKITPIDQIAIRGTFSKGFRAPNAPESGGGTAGTATSTDPVRCALAQAQNLPTGTINSVCSAQSAVLVSAGNPNLAPERSKVYTGGIVLDPTRSTSISADYFKIVRKNEIIAGSGTNESNVLAGNVVRDPNTTIAGLAGDPGALVAILTPYQNSSRTEVRGVDIEARQDIPIGTAYGKLALGVKYTHLFTYKVTDNTGAVTEYANTHGNCNITNCIGTPADRANADVTYSIGDVVVSTIVNFRGGFRNRETQEAGISCETILHTGQDDPGNCRIGSFTTFDLTARWNPTRNWEINGSIQNLFDRVPPFDPTTYGAIGYNPLDYSGAIGRFFLVGARYKF